mgnify:CR=1 FL=1
MEINAAKIIRIKINLNRPVAIRSFKSSFFVRAIHLKKIFIPWKISPLFSKLLFYFINTGIEQFRKTPFIFQHSFLIVV